MCFSSLATNLTKLIIMEDKTQINVPKNGLTQVLNVEFSTIVVSPISIFSITLVLNGLKNLAHITGFCS